MWNFAKSPIHAMCTHKCAHTFGMWLWLLFLCIGSFWIDRRNPSKTSVLAMAPGTTNYCSIYIYIYIYKYIWLTNQEKKSLFPTSLHCFFFSRVGTPIYKCVYHLSIPGTVNLPKQSLFQPNTKVKGHMGSKVFIWILLNIYIYISLLVPRRFLQKCRASAPFPQRPQKAGAPDVEMGEMLLSSGSTSGGSTTPAATAAAAEALATLASTRVGTAEPPETTKDELIS